MQTWSILNWLIVLNIFDNLGLNFQYHNVIKFYIDNLSYKKFYSSKYNNYKIFFVGYKLQE